MSTHMVENVRLQQSIQNHPRTSNNMYDGERFLHTFSVLRL